MTTNLKEKLLFIENNCINPQDAIIIRLFLEGIEMHEIVYLKEKSLDLQNKTLLITESSGKKRIQNVSQKCIELFHRAINQTHYVFYSSKHPSKNCVTQLRDSPFVIKASYQDFLANESMIQEIDSVILRTIYMRLRNLADIHSFPELPNITTAKIESKQLIYA